MKAHQIFCYCVWIICCRFYSVEFTSMQRGCMDSPSGNDTLCLLLSPTTRLDNQHLLSFSLIPAVILLMISSSDKEQCDCLRCFSVAWNTRLIFYTRVSTMRQFHFSPSDPIWVLQGVSRRAVCLCRVTFFRTGHDMKTTVSMLMWDTPSYCGHTLAATHFSDHTSTPDRRLKKKNLF